MELAEIGERSHGEDSVLFYGIKEDNRSDKIELIVKEVPKDYLKSNNTLHNLTGDLLQAEHTCPL